MKKRMIGLAVFSIFGFQNCQNSFELLPPGEVSLFSTASSKVCSQVGSTGIRRLNREEIRYSLMDLLALTDLMQRIPEEASGGSGFINDGASLLNSDSFLRQLMQMVETAVSTALAQPGTPLLNCTSGTAEDCALNSALRLANLAYRRPLTSSENSDLRGIFSANKVSGPAIALAVTLEKIFLSPQYLFVTSFKGGAISGVRSLDSSELATRLALFLWNSLPDQQLINLASSDQLRNPVVLQSEVRRLLKDPRAKRGLTSLFQQWYGYLRVADDSAIIRDNLTPELRASMIAETTAFIDDLILMDRSPLALVNANYSFVNGPLAQLYGVSVANSTQFQRVEFPANSRRQGIVTQASIMTLQAHQSDSAPIQRGNYLLERIFCDPPPPPPFVPASLPSTNTGATTLRGLLAAHTANPVCAGCHKAMDQIGLSLENFDQLGQYRSQYLNGAPVDASGAVYNSTYRDYLEFIGGVDVQTKIKSCISQKIVSYAINRRLLASEACAVETAQATLGPTTRLSDFIAAVVANDFFRQNKTDSR